MNSMQRAFQKYSESEDFKESLTINKTFEHPAGLAWGAFIEAWEAVEHRVYLTGMLAFLAGFGICWLVFVR
jgi:anaerobic C4-dicarboxylate transporter